jgi:hypothetical protein
VLQSTFKKFCTTATQGLHKTQNTSSGAKRRYLYFGFYVPSKPLVAMAVTSKNFIDDRTKKKSWAYHLD